MTNYSFKNVLMKAMFTSIVYKIFLFKGRLVLSSVQQGAGNERVSQFTNFGNLDDYWSKLKKKQGDSWLFIDSILHSAPYSHSFPLTQSP